MLAIKQLRTKEGTEFHNNTAHAHLYPVCLTFSDWPVASCSLAYEHHGTLCVSWQRAVLQSRVIEPFVDRTVCFTVIVSFEYPCRNCVKIVTSWWLQSNRYTNHNTPLQRYINCGRIQHFHVKFWYLHYCLSPRPTLVNWIITTLSSR